MTEEIDSQLNADHQDKEYTLKVNKAVSFNVIKKMALEIFLTETNKVKVFEKLHQLFAMNPVAVRHHRNIPRKKISHTKSMNFQKRGRKHVF